VHSFDWHGDAYHGGVRHTKGVKPTSVSIHHNGDFSGNVTINVPTSLGEPQVHHYTSKNVDYHQAELKVPYEVLEALVLKKWQNDAVDVVERFGAEDTPKLILIGAILKLLSERKD
jgi:hypothetical protein